MIKESDNNNYLIDLFFRLYINKVRVRAVLRPVYLFHCTQPIIDNIL